MIYLPVSARTSVLPSAQFPIDNLSSCSWILFIHIVIVDEWYWIVGGRNPFVFNRITALFTLEKQFLAYYSFTIYDISMKRYSYFYHQRLHIVTKNYYSDCSSSGVICP